MSQPSKRSWSIVSRGDNPRVISPFKSREDAVSYYEDHGNLSGLPVAFVEAEAPEVVTPPGPAPSDRSTGKVTLPDPAPTPEKQPPGPAQ